MLLPPEVLLVLGAGGGEHVVEVHDHVDGVVDEVAEGAVAPGDELDADPGLQGRQRVVVQVQEGHLAVFLAQHEEYLQRERKS